MERIALKIGYLGTQYHGFQIQPQSVGPTIEGELFKALKNLEIIEDRASSNYSAAGRTDKGVHALSQVLSFDTAHPNVTPRRINSLLPEDIWAVAIAKPPSGFNARKDAISREYRYFLWVQPDVGMDITGMREASELLIGIHDFSNFAQPDNHEEYDKPLQGFRGQRGGAPLAGSYSTRTEIKRVSMEKRNSFIIIDIEARSFLRKMVRKIVSALKMVGSGRKDKRWVEDLLELRITEQIEPAPAFGLVLKNVSYQGITFVEDDYAKRRIAARLKEDLIFHAAMAEVLGDMVNEYAQSNTKNLQYVR
ncbi:MAG: tRNA pseudouridine(38-40) synthase TruA [Methanophagales archaeon]|nr:tRNA pseudouridine(38-40) synthase TruA [Methanophagales archaeon]